jgi:hypothetical protein
VGGAGRRCGLTALAFLVAGLGGCGKESETRSEHVPTSVGIGDYPGFRELDQEEVVRRYVEALNARDGRAFCRAVAPWISGPYDLATKDRDSELAHLGGGCPRVADAFIGFVGDTGTEKFIRLDLEDVDVAAGEDGLNRADVRGTLTVDLVHESDRRVEREFRDVVWLVREGDAWRVARTSRVARAAGLGMPGESPEADPAARPNVGEYRQAYLADLSSFRDYERKREGTYRPTGEPADCSGAVSIDDPRGDPRDYNLPAPQTPLPRRDQIDLRKAEVRRDGDRICIALTMWGEIEGPLTASFNMRDSAAGSEFIQIFDVELRRDTSARVTSGEDDEERPISVPATVGLEGPVLTLQLDRDSFEAGRPIPATAPDAQPPTDSFTFMISTQAAAGDRRAAHDDLGPDSVPTPFGYPGGRRCVLAQRQPTC